MASTTSPVTSSVLAWAVGEDGRDRATLSEALEVDPDTFDAWVDGYALPTTGQVSALAKLLKRPRALFFLPQPPAASTLPASFRHPPGEEREVGVETRRAVRRARRVQQAVSWSLRDEGPISMPSARTSTSPELAAAEARGWLGVSDSAQEEWRNEYDALYAWRAALEERQVLVFSLRIGRGDVRGFSAWDDYAPLIVTNSAGVNPAARSFTLMHELGHLFLRQDAACLETVSALAGVEVKRWCEQFGAALMMPAEITRRWADSRSMRGQTAGLDDVKAMMRRFRVSGRAAALRLIDLGYAARSLYGDVIRVFVPKPPAQDQNFASAPRPTLRRREYGDRVLRTVINTLPPRDALSILRLEVGDVRRLAEEVPGVQEI